MFFSDIHIAAAIASKSHAGSGHQCRHCVLMQVEAACRRPQSFLRQDLGEDSLRKLTQRVDDPSRFYARCLEMASEMCSVSAHSSSCNRRRFAAKR